MHARRLLDALICGPVLAAMSVGACGSDDDLDSAGGGGGSSSDANTDSSTLDVGRPDGTGTGGASELDPLCGVALGEECTPDNPMSCSATTVDGGNPGDGDASTGGSTGTGGTAGATGEGGGAGEAGSAGGAGAPGSGGSGGSVGTGGSGVGGSSPTTQVLGCQVMVEDGQVGRRCALAGEGQLDAPCVSGSDCAPGYACVGQGMAGRCAPYCCGAGGDELCSPGMVCSPRALRVEQGATAPEVPVCVRADNCSLADPYPCPSDQECQCSEGMACMAVRVRTTNCEEPGDGRVGEACPCAWGHICSQATGMCLKLCSIVSLEDGDCAAGEVCQASAILPDNWGLCVGDADGG